MTRRVILALFPFALAFGAALLAKGYTTIGDGFTAGAVAGLGAAVQYLAVPYDQARRRVGAAWATLMIPSGLLTALGLLLLPSLWGVAPVSHFPGPGEHVVTLGILELHSALIFDLGVAVVVYGALVLTFDRLFPPSAVDWP